MKKHTILCIDDEEKILNSLRRLFMQEQYNILTASNGMDALEILEEQPVDVVITDQRMPGIQGLEILRRARELAPRAVRIMVTGYADIDVTIAAINEGKVDRYITKPWNNRELLEVVQSALEVKVDSEQDSTKQQQEMQELAEALRRASFTTVKALSHAIELKDKYTNGHCVRVLKYAVMIARQLEYKGERLLTLKYAALLHDIGKIGVPSRILNKTGPLDDEEWAIIKEHPRNGAMITMDVDFLNDTSRIILEHHERVDGRGYPYGKKGDDLQEESRIITIADVYDALTSTRSYRKAFSMEKALEILQEGRGNQFDHALTDIFIREVRRTTDEPDLAD